MSRTKPVQSDVTNDTFDARAAKSPAYVSFLLTDQEGDSADCKIYYSLNRLDFFPITLTGSNDLDQVPSGAEYTVQWDFETDLGDESYEGNLTVRLDVIGGNSTELAAELGNDAPEILSAARPPEEESTGIVPTSLPVSWLSTAREPAVVPRTSHSGRPGWNSNCRGKYRPRQRGVRPG